MIQDNDCLYLYFYMYVVNEKNNPSDLVYMNIDQGMLHAFLK